MEYKALKFEVKDINGKTGEFTGYASTRQKDSYNDIVAPNAFKRTIDHHKGRLPILWFHNPSEPIGLSTHMEEDNHGLYTKGQIDLDIEKGREVYSGMKKGYIDRLSIGYKTIQDDYDKEQDARILKEVQLLEYSMITKNFAANDAALLTSVKTLPNMLQQVQSLSSKDTDPSLIQKTIKSLQNLLADSPQCTQPLFNWEHSPFGTVSESKATSGAADLPLAAHKREWDAAAAQKRIFAWAGGDDFDPTKARRAFFWYDSANPNRKGAYKLPFADVTDGKLIAIPRAIFAVAAALDGARGGVQIPLDDQDRIKSKVATYYRRMREEFDDDTITPPWGKSKGGNLAIRTLIDEMKNYVRSDYL